MKTLSILAVIAATATPALAQYQPSDRLDYTSISINEYVDQMGGDFSSKQELDNKRR